MSDEESTAPVLRVGGSSFRLADSFSNWRMMKLASAMKSNDDMRALGEMHDFIVHLVHPDEQQALDDHLSSVDVDPSDLEHAIGDALVEMAGRGKVPPATQAGVPLDHLPSRSSGGSPAPAAPSRRVVSLSQGTVEYAPLDETSSTA